METKYIFLGSARCFHTIDWYKSACKVFNKKIDFITDLIDGEGFQCLVEDKNYIKELFILDKFLSKNYDQNAHKIRNLLKLLLLPIQAFKLRKLIYNCPNHLIYAHSTYYAFLAFLSGAKYVSTPQGSEVLVRIEGSIFYKVFSYIAHKNALLVTVDSASMQEKLLKNLGIRSSIVQNGVDIVNIKKLSAKISKKDIELLSIRGISENYQIKEIVQSKKSFLDGKKLYLCAPFIDKSYLSGLNLTQYENIKFMGRLEKKPFYEKLARAQIVISIPKSDSSPRSVYESIFFGAIIIATNNKYIDDLPDDMKERIVTIDIEDDDWLMSSYSKAKEKLRTIYIPSNETLRLFDQSLSVERVNKILQKKSINTL